MTKQRKQPSFIARLRAIDRATDRLELGATADDVTYLIEHLAFTAWLVLHSDHFTPSEQKTKLGKVLNTAQNAAKALRDSINQEDA